MSEIPYHTGDFAERAGVYDEAPLKMRQALFSELVVRSSATICFSIFFRLYKIVIKVTTSMFAISIYHPTVRIK